MSLIRYQTPTIAAWPSLDRWANLRDEMSDLLEMPFWSNFGRQTSSSAVGVPRSIFIRTTTTWSRSLNFPECGRKTSKYRSTTVR